MGRPPAQIPILAIPASEESVPQEGIMKTWYPLFFLGKDTDDESFFKKEHLSCLVDSVFIFKKVSG